LSPPLPPEFHSPPPLKQKEQVIKKGCCDLNTVKKFVLSNKKKGEEAKKK